MQLEKLVEKFKGKKILVTGGCGFIGRNLVERLKELDAEVRIFDINGMNGEYGDVRDYHAILAIMEGCDYVYHLAAVVGVDEALENPAMVMDVNLGGTMNVLKACRHHNIKKLVFTSSSEVYGDRKTENKLMKEADTLAPMSIYGLAKGAAEAWCLSYNHDFGMDVACVRFFNVYGLGQRRSFVVPKWLDDIKNNERPVVLGDGKQIRCFTHYTDAINGAVLAMAVKESTGEVFNIGNDTEVPIIDLAMFMIEKSGKEIKPFFKQRLREYEIMNRKPDISKAKFILGYEPKVHWKEGIGKMVEDAFSN